MENYLTVEDAVKMFCDAEEASREERALAEKCRDYYDGDQWTAEEKAALRKACQPVITYNFIRPKIDFLRGFFGQQNLAPKALPRTPQHEDGSHAATDALRFVCDNNRFDDIDLAVFEERAIEGVAAVEIGARLSRRDEVEINLERIPWDRFYRDPHARLADFSDATYFGVVLWMDLEQAKQQWPDAEDALAMGEGQGSASDETFEDRPHWTLWSDGKRRRVKICRLWFLDPKKGWCWGTHCKGAWLDEPKPSPYLDEDGEPMCGIIAQAAYLDRENRAYGVVRDMLSPQDDYNKRRSKASHLLNSRQTAGEKGAVDSVSKMKRELAKPDGHVEYNPSMKWEILQTGDLSAGQFQLMQESASVLAEMGPNASLLGKEEKDLSGKAIQAQQRGGMIEISGLTAGQKAWRLRVYHAAWAMVRQYWTNERWVRVTDDQTGLRFVGLNQPLTLRDQLQQEGEEIPPELEADPRLDAVVGVQNNVEELDVDIILDESDDPLIAQNESFERLMQIAEIANTQGQPIPPQILIERLPDVRERDAVLDALNGDQQAQAAQAQAMQLQQAGTQAEVEKTAAEARRANAAAAKDESEAQAAHAHFAQPY